MVKFFVEELAGGVRAAVKARGSHTAVILSPSAYGGGSLTERVELINQLLACVGGSGTALALVDLLAS